MALVSEFLDALASDSELRETYSSEPIAVMEAFGLSEEQQALILDGDPRDLRNIIEAEVGPTPYIVIRLHMIVIRKTAGRKSKPRKSGKKKS